MSTIGQIKWYKLNSKEWSEVMDRTDSKFRLSDSEYDELKKLVYKIALKRFNAGANSEYIKGLISVPVEVGIYEANVCCALGEDEDDRNK